MKRELIGNQVFCAIVAAFQAVCDDVMSVVMRQHCGKRGWWDDVQPADRRPLVRGLAASGSVR